MKTRHSLPKLQIGNAFKQILAILLGGLGVLFAAILVTIICFEIFYSGRIYPGISVSGVDLGGLRPAAAAAKLDQYLTYSQKGRILFEDQNLIWQATPAQLGFSMDSSAEAQSAYQTGRQTNLYADFYDQLRAWTSGIDLPPTVTYDQRVTQNFLLALAGQVDKPVIEANVSLNGVDVVVHSGQIGRTLDIPATLAITAVQLQTLQDSVIPLVVHQTDPVILDASKQADLAKSILSQPLTLTLPQGQSGAGPWSIDAKTLASMLTIEKVKSSDGTYSFQVAIDSSLLSSYLENLAPSLATDPKNARFTFNDDTHQLDLLQNAVIGRSLNVSASITAINQGIAQGNHSIALVFDTKQPTVTDNATTKSLGITQLVESTTTYFYGSSSARIQNITAAASRFHGLLVAPGETFSMADALGDINLDNGYAEAPIILGDQTIQGVGGGVCQVSTTLFRAVFFAGYPIVERHPHAYMVGYYEQKSNGTKDTNLAGLDATVFVPLVDFKFTNDSPYWILMETYIKGDSLTWKLYSTSDGRSVDWKTSGLQNTVDPPAPLYTLNSDLTAGTIKQVDWAVEGGDVTITRVVSRNGSVYFQDTFSTHYEAWNAKYEYGPGAKIPTASPTSTP